MLSVVANSEQRLNLIEAALDLDPGEIEGVGIGKSLDGYLLVCWYAGRQAMFM
ncbi:hypothetical protein N790_08360 [Arenimonas malthae CC-JY-1]|uniref:Uncharacterized protein n=1 Tax=Arenimonas malthae CC-JY-1 TaxID=1384054 RepID=A0A091B6Z2_9GAMM|nr:hypothetical protein N790_08360 [Arenimonas malthae CC-JY-1]